MNLRISQIYTLLILTLPAFSFGCGLSDAPRAEAVLKSSNQMKELILAVRNYEDTNGYWPEELSDVKSLTDTDFEVLMVNPITEENPGYEYVKPTDDANPATTVILYPLRGGERDTSLKVGYADGRVAEMNPEAASN